MEKYGFVYLWFDRKHKRFYVGCHWGTESDGYICSSSWMKQAYRHRPTDFKRKILARIYTTHADMFAEEQRFLNMIKPNEIKTKYYNIRIDAITHWIQNTDTSLTVIEKLRQANLGKKATVETRQKMSLSRKDKEHSKATRKKIGASDRSYMKTPEYRLKMSLAKAGVPSQKKGKVYVSSPT